MRAVGGEQAALDEAAVHEVGHLVETLQRGRSRVRRLERIALGCKIAMAQPPVVVSGADESVEVDLPRGHRTVRPGRSGVTRTSV